MKSAALHALIIASFAAAAALADPGDYGTPQFQSDPVLEKATAALARQDWGRAAEVLRAGLVADPGNANYHNLFAYSVRKGANPNMDLVFKHYHEALRIEPRHRGAHEYIGEAYLMVGNLGKAKEHLDALDRLCSLPCEEYTKLKKAVAEFEQRQARQ